MMMMQAGKNVVIEKPMSMNSKMVKELTAKAKEKGVFIMEVCDGPGEMKNTR